MHYQPHEDDTYGEEDKNADSYMQEVDNDNSEGLESEMDEGTLKEDYYPQSHLELRDAKFAKVGYSTVFNKFVSPKFGGDAPFNPLMRESLDNPNYLSEKVNSNFHARTLYMLDKELVFSE